MWLVSLGLVLASLCGSSWVAAAPSAASVAVPEYDAPAVLSAVSVAPSPIGTTPTANVAFASVSAAMSPRALVAVGIVHHGRLLATEGGSLDPEASSMRPERSTGSSQIRPTWVSTTLRRWRRCEISLSRASNSGLPRLSSLGLTTDTAPESLKSSS